MGQVYHEGFCRGNRNVRIHAEARKRAYQGYGAAVRQPNVKMLRRDPTLTPFSFPSKTLKILAQS